MKKLFLLLITLSTFKLLPMEQPSPKASSPTVQCTNLDVMYINHANQMLPTYDFISPQNSLMIGHHSFNIKFHLRARGFTTVASSCCKCSYTKALNMKYDFVCSFASLNETINKSALIKMAYKKLTPGGCFMAILESPNNEIKEKLFEMLEKKSWQERLKGYPQNTIRAFYKYNQQAITNTSLLSPYSFISLDYQHVEDSRTFSSREAVKNWLENYLKRFYGLQFLSQEHVTKLTHKLSRQLMNAEESLVIPCSLTRIIAQKDLDPITVVK